MDTAWRAWEYATALFRSVPFLSLAEAAYLKILESSQTLLTVLKREAVNISKKKQASS